MFETNFLTQINDKTYCFVKLLTGENSPLEVNDITIGDVAGFDNLDVVGINMPTEYELNGVPYPAGNLVLINENLVKSLFFDFFKKLPDGVRINGNDTIIMSQNLPGIDLINTATTPKKNDYYLLNYRLNLAATVVHVVQPFPAVPNSIYALTFYLNVK